MTPPAKPIPDARYFLDCDDDGHWFVIPDKFRLDWEQWLQQDWTNELSDFQPPEYALEVDGPNMVTFTDPIHE